MSGKRRAVTQINIVAKRFEETLKFYRLLGLDLPEPMNQPPGALRAPANVDKESCSRSTTSSLRASTALLGEPVAAASS